MMKLYTDLSQKNYLKKKLMISGYIQHDKKECTLVIVIILNEGSKGTILISYYDIVML